jgi:hypothetical protein
LTPGTLPVSWLRGADSARTAGPVIDKHGHCQHIGQFFGKDACNIVSVSARWVGHYQGDGAARVFGIASVRNGCQAEHAEGAKAASIQKSLHVESPCSSHAGGGECKEILVFFCYGLNS